MVGLQGFRGYARLCGQGGNIVRIHSCALCHVRHCGYGGSGSGADGSNGGSDRCSNCGESGTNRLRNRSQLVEFALSLVRCLCSIFRVVCQLRDVLRAIVRFFAEIRYRCLRLLQRSFRFNDFALKIPICFSADFSGCKLLFNIRLYVTELFDLF